MLLFRFYHLNYCKSPTTLVKMFPLNQINENLTYHVYQVFGVCYYLTLSDPALVRHGLTLELVNQMPCALERTSKLFNTTFIVV